MSSGQEERGCMNMRFIEYHDYKTLLGPCFISFSIPLLVPGVVLTTVGSYGNDNTFPTFGAWHITGIVILTFAVLMLFIGIALKCFYKPIISADIEEYLTPNPSMVTGSKNLAYDSGSPLASMLNNKVGPHDSDDNYRMVSTHDKRETSDKHRHGHGKDKGHKVTDDPHKPEPKTAFTKGQQQQKPQQQSQQKQRAQGEKEHVPSVETPDGRSHHHNDSTHISRNTSNTQSSNKAPDTRNHGNTGDVVMVSAAGSKHVTKTTVTATITADVETTLTSPRDRHSDADSQSSQQDVKRRKKKKRKRHHHKHSPSDTLTQAESDGETSARAKQELPVLRTVPPSLRISTDGVDSARTSHATDITDTQHSGGLDPHHRSVLVHDGDHAHHDPNMHVHFRNTPDFARTPSYEKGFPADIDNEAYYV